MSRLPGKRARPVLRGPRRSNAPGLPAERFFAELTTRLLRRGVHHSVAELEADIRTWITTWNDNPRPFVWIKTAEQILESISTYCRRLLNATNDSAH